MAEGHRTFDHTGDLGLEVWASTPERLFARAAEALLAQVAEVPPGGDTGDEAAAEPVRVVLTGDDAFDLFVHWLNSVLLEADLRQRVWTRVTMVSWSPTELEAWLDGPRLDPRRHTLLREVKAVSHHGLELDLAPPTCRASLVLDL